MGSYQQGCRQRGSADNQFSVQVNRLKEVFEIEVRPGTDHALGEIFGVSKQAVSKWRYGGIPKKRLEWVVANKGVSRDYIMAGKGPGPEKQLGIAEEKPLWKTTPLDENTLRKTILITEEAIMETEPYYLEPTKKAEVILMIYDILLERRGKEIPKSMAIKLIKLAT